MCACALGAGGCVCEVGEGGRGVEPFDSNALDLCVGERGRR
jgi:hypothetical protein